MKKHALTWRIFFFAAFVLSVWVVHEVFGEDRLHDLGCVAGCSPYDPASVDNPYGWAGNPYSETNNPYGKYRNPYGKYQNPYDSSGSIREYAMPDGTIHDFGICGR